VQKNAVYVLVFIAVVGSAFLGGYLARKYGQPETDNTGIVAEYEARLAVARIINSDLQNENQRIADYNSRITKRLDEAKTIIDGINGQIDTDGDTVQRIIDNLSRLEQAISVLFETK
jgi:hypothetical protein